MLSSWDQRRPIKILTPLPSLQAHNTYKPVFQKERGHGDACITSKSHSLDKVEERGGIG